jgi:cobalt-zinc-cadmium efflux system membrane fusion protein
MSRKQLISILSVLVIGSILILAIDKHEANHHHGHGHDSHAEEESVKGPHGGRLLGTEDFQVEVTIYEPNIPPQSRIYFYKDGEIIDPSFVQFTMELHRIDRVDVFNYQKESNYLLGDKIVEEPHSFNVKVKAIYEGKTYSWEYESHEGRTHISSEAAKRAELVIETAGPARLRSTVHVNGKITPNNNRLVHVKPRFAGVVKEVRKQQGDRVQKNDTLAVIESNESLTTYQIKSKISGSIIARDASIGEVVSEDDEIFVLADLDSIWAEFNVYPKDFSKIKKNQTVIIDGGTAETTHIEATISYLSTVTTEETQTLLARAEIDNTNGNWRPGSYISADIVVNEREVPVAIKASALQTFRDWDVVFQQVGELFEIAILELGARDGEWVEVISGLKAGTKYVTKNSFVVKADIMKSGATHNH